MIPMPAQTTLWRDRNFVRLWLAQSISAFGARITRDGLPVAAVLTLGASPAQIGLLSALANGPALVVGLAAGGLVDRSRRRRLMIWADVGRALVLAAVPVAALLHVLALPQLYLTAALVGAASVLFEIADHAYLPSLVAREDLTAANASLSSTEAVAEIAGPALAGVLFQVFAGPVAIAANAATYLVSAAVLGTIRRPEPAPVSEPQVRWMEDVTKGFRTALAEPLVRPLLLIAGWQSLFGGVFGALYVIFCLKVAHLTPGLLGLTIAAGGIGALAGALVAGMMSRRLGFGPAILVAQLAYGGALLLVPLAPGEPIGGMTSLLIAQLFGDAFAIASIVLAVSLRQTVIPDALLGRVGAAFKAVGGGGAVIGALVGGVVGEHLGVRPALWVAALGILVAPLLAVGSQLPRLRKMPGEG